MITLRWQSAALIMIAAFVLGFVMHKGKHEEHSASHEKLIVRDRVDTVHTLVQVPISRLQLRAGGRDAARHAICIDTLLHADTSASAPDTISICYARNIFSLAIGFAPRRTFLALPITMRDTFYSREDTVRITDSRAWYADVLTIVLSILAGVVVGRL